jgi:hypothetical protein
MAKGQWSSNYFAIYRGDEFLAHGPIQELAWKFNIREKSLRELSHKSRYDKVAKSKKPDEWLLAVKVEELTDDDITIKRRKGANNEKA